MRGLRTPSVSIIVRTLNEAKFLPECLQEIGKQAYSGSVEVVVVDSGSTDETVCIAADFVQKLSISQNQSLHLAGRLILAVPLVVARYWCYFQHIVFPIMKIGCKI